MSKNTSETFNPSLLSDVNPEPSAGGSSAEVAGSFASQLACGGGDSEFVIPEQKRQASPVTIAVIALLGVAGGGIWWMNQRAGGPNAAVAADPQVVAARESIQQFLAGGASSVDEMRDLLADTEQIRTRFEAYGEDRRVPLEGLKTNPFWLEKVDEEPTTAEPSVDLSKEQEAARAQREAERLRAAEAAAAADANALEVQTIFYGKNSTCMINGKFCRVGQMIDDFEIVSILPDVVEVRRGEWEFELRIRK